MDLIDYLDEDGELERVENVQKRLESVGYDFEKDMELFVDLYEEKTRKERKNG